VQTTMSLAMIAVGGWLLIPWFASLAGLFNLPQNGLGLLQAMVSVPNTGVAVNSTIQNASYLQHSLSSSLAVPDGLGLISLAVGALIGLSVLLPHKMLYSNHP
jgi:hypothetical protein